MVRESYLKVISDSLAKQAETLEKISEQLEKLVCLWLEAAGRKSETEETEKTKEAE